LECKAEGAEGFGDDGGDEMVAEVESNDVGAF
jgi:hypothetical protein